MTTQRLRAIVVAIWPLLALALLALTGCPHH